MNVVPRPCSLCTLTLPPISSARLLAMDRPRPLPPYCRAVAALSCSKGWNRRSSISRLMPQPVSATVKRTRARPSRGSSSCAVSVTLPPAAVNL